MKAFSLDIGAFFYVREEGRWSLEKSDRCTEETHVFSSNLRAALDEFTHVVATACRAFADAA
jgi:hypothetical protein